MLANESSRQTERFRSYFSKHDGRNGEPMQVPNSKTVAQQSAGRRRENRRLHAQDGREAEGVRGRAEDEVANRDASAEHHRPDTHHFTPIRVDGAELHR